MTNKNPEKNNSPFHIYVHSIIVVLGCICYGRWGLGGASVVSKIKHQNSGEISFKVEMGGKPIFVYTLYNISLCIIL